MKAQRELDRRKFMIVPDVRFDNEVEWLRKNGGLLILVQRGSTSISDPKHLAHASEAGIDHHVGKTMRDVIIGNTGTIEALAHSVEYILNSDEVYQKNKLPEVPYADVPDGDVLSSIRR